MTRAEFGSAYNALWLGSIEPLRELIFEEAWRAASYSSSEAPENFETAIKAFVESSNARYYYLETRIVGRYSLLVPIAKL